MSNAALLGHRPPLLAVALILVVLMAGCVGHSARSPARKPNPSRVTAASRPPSAFPAPAAPLPVPRPRGRAQLIQRRITGASAFRARPAYLYLPSAVSTKTTAHLPVLELLHGVPGRPSDWATHGELVATADAFAASHSGAAPIIVMPDINGSQNSDTECIRTRTGQDVESYLTSDVVSYVRARYAAVTGNSRWWVAGLSEGGICAAMLALRHPTLYAGFGDFSGLAVPTVQHVSREMSDQQLYGSDPAAILEHEPVWLMRHRRYPDLRAWFSCGAQDVRVRAAQETLVAAARAAHIPTRSSLRPGKHSWSIWRTALRALLPVVWTTR